MPFIALLVFSGVCMALQAADSVTGQAYTASCNACHGVLGHGPAPAFPSLAGQGQRYLLKQLLDIQRGARTVPEMTGVLSAFSEEDLADIAALYAAQQPLIGATDAGSATDGQALYSAGDMNRRIPACVGCHSPEGAGNAAAGFPRLGGQHAEYVRNQLMAFRDGSRSNDGDTRVMRTLASRLNDHDIAALSAYIQGLH